MLRNMIDRVWAPLEGLIVWMGDGWNMTDFVISGVEPKNSSIGLITNMAGIEAGYQDGTWMELAEDRVQ
jgi:hypothetical protein